MMAATFNSVCVHFQTNNQDKLHILWFVQCDYKEH